MPFPQIDPVVFLPLAAVLGLVVGSFLNVLVHRLPIMMDREMSLAAREQLADESALAEGDLSVEALTGESDAAPRARYDLWWPPSACPACDRPIRPLENIPLLGYLRLGGRCAGCRAAIPLRYPLVELLTGLLFLAVAWQYGQDWSTPFGWLFMALLVALSAIDLDCKLLPDALVYPLLWTGLLVSLTGLPIDPRDAILGCAAGYAVLAALRWLWLQLFHREALGLGDAKLLGALGAWLGWQPLPSVLLAAALTAIAVAVVRRLLRRQGPRIEIAFGPYLALAGALHLLLDTERAGLLAALLR